MRTGLKESATFITADARGSKLINVPVQDIGFTELLGLIRRRVRSISVVTLGLTLLTGIVLWMIEPQYTARTLVMITPQTVNIANLESVAASLPVGAETVGNQIEVVRSRRLADLVISELQLDKDPEFNTALRPKGLLSRILGKTDAQGNVQQDDPIDLSSIADTTSEVIAGGATSITRTTDYSQYASKTNELPLISGQRVRIINAFLSRLDIAQRPQSQVISIGFSSLNATAAARIANTLADLYIRDQLDAKFDAIRQATAWLNEHVSILRDKVDASEKAVEKYRQESGLLEGAGITLEEQEISELNSQLILARAARNEAAARERQILKLLDSPGGVETAGEVLGSVLIQQLRQQEAQILAQVAELSVEFGDLHPKMVKLRAEAQELKSKIDIEINKIVAGLESEVAIARAREYSLARSLSDAKLRVGEANKASVTLRALEREAQANRLLLETMMARAMETRSQNDMRSQQPDARIISRADVPVDPSFPLKKGLFVLAFLGAAFTGLLVAFVLEQIDKGFRSGEQIEQFTGLPSLGFVPQVSQLVRGKEAPATYFLGHTRSPFAESIRSLYANITMLHQQSELKTILIASTQLGEGKTTIATCLATLLALEGRRVVVVDADCRRPSVHRVFGVSNDPGLVDLLIGEATIDQVIKPGKRKGAIDEVIMTGRHNGGVDVIPAGMMAHNPPGILGSLKMSALLRRLAEQYEYVIVDSPPLLAVSDAIVLTSRVDATIFVVKWGDTQREAVNQGLKRIVNAKGRLAGVLISMANVKTYARYGYVGPIRYTGIQA